jgi:hypothetical protein
MNLLAASDQQQLDHDGYLVLERIVPPNYVKAMRDRLEELFLVTEQEHRGTLIVGGLVEDEVFDAAWLHPRVLAAVRHVLGDGVRLTGVSSRGIQPGYGQQALHVDVLNVHCGHSAVHNLSNGPRHAIFTAFWRRDSPMLLLDALPVADPNPKILARFRADVQSLLKG